ncbi:MAG: hypothetical protein LAO51_15905 [Acidobacteriia bacterium]|nr:hypothetical protein [Terriglobia bacterium]
MRYRVRREVLDLFPELRIGIVVGRGLRVGKAPGSLCERIWANITMLRKAHGHEVIGSHCNILAWQNAYRAFGTEPKKYKPTAEALVRRVLEQSTFPHVNAAVDAYLAVELLHLLPIGGYDLDMIQGDIELRTSRGGEEFLAIGAAKCERTAEGEVVYADESGILTRRWNYRDCERAKITERSTNIILTSEAAYGMAVIADLEGTIEKVIEYEREFCGGMYSKLFLDARTPETDVLVRTGC